MGAELTVLHWAFTAFILFILVAMIMRRDCNLLCIAGIFTIGYIAKGNLYQAVIGIFNSFVYAINELAGTILIISLIVAMSKALLQTGVNTVMVAPFARLMRSPGLTYWIIGMFMMVISWFFWPSPSSALMGAVLLPVARSVGLPAMGVAVAMNLFGHGIALSGDWIIQAAPKLTADAAGIPVQQVVNASFPLVFVMGAVTVSAAYWLLKRDMAAGRLSVKQDNPALLELTAEEAETPFFELKDKVKIWLAAGVPFLFALDVAAMYWFDLRAVMPPRSLAEPQCLSCWCLPL